MGFRIAMALPHPPVLLPEVGGRDADVVVRTREALGRARQALVEARPDALFLVGPHAPAQGDAFPVYEAGGLEGSFASFGAPGARLSVRGSPEALTALLGEIEREGLGARRLRTRLDHGTLVPLWFLLGQGWEGSPPLVVAVGASWASLDDHLALGRAMGRAADATDAAFVASGDLSHRLTPEAPNGYTPRGEEFDRLVLDTLRSGRLSELAAIPPDLAEEAGNCGLRPLCALAGALGDGVPGDLLSYEGPFGVGYPVVLFRP